MTTNTSRSGPNGAKVYHGMMCNGNKKGPGRSPRHRHLHNPPGTKLARRFGIIPRDKHG